jgi:hypothetical protein
MVAFATTSVVISRADQPAIVQRFLSTSERFLFNSAAGVSARVQSHPERRTTARTAS